VIWFDLAMTLLLTLRMALFGPTLPRLFDPDNCSSSLAGGEGREENLSVASEEGDSLQFSQIAPHNCGNFAITYSCNLI
jgi:hypothetical protein